MKPFRELTGKQKAVELLRWLAVLPAAVIGRYIVHFIVGAFGGLAIKMGWLTPGSAGVAYYLYSCAYYAPKETAFVIVGTKTAPRFRLATMVLLTAIGILCSCVVHILGQRNVGSVNYMHWTLESCGAIAGAAYVLIVELPRSRQNSHERIESEIS